MITFIIVQAFISGCVGFMWSTKNFLNTAIKVALFANVIWCIYTIFEQKFGGAILENGMRLM